MPPQRPTTQSESFIPIDMAFHSIETLRARVGQSDPFKDALADGDANLLRRYAEQAEASIRRLVAITDLMDAPDDPLDPILMDAWDACVAHGDFGRGRKT